MQTAVTSTSARIEDRYVTIDGLRLRYVEAGEGPAVVFLHGGSLGSSADVFLRNLPVFARAGFRAIAFDQPGFGLSDAPADHSASYRRKSIPAFLRALALDSPAVVAHSQAGGLAVRLALEQPDLFSRIVILGTGSLLPERARIEDKGAQAQQRLERRMAAQEPTLEDTRKLLEANLYHHDLITDEELALRHARSTGACFEAFVARNALADASQKAQTSGEPIWRRLKDIKAPMLMIYGRNDRAQAAERVVALQDLEPSLDLHLVDHCKHLVPWDAQAAFERMAIDFLNRHG
ncbi:MAG: 4,5-9,10-diseco-3-hydroxy-5,9, 17-trioxoandrosta(10),2-diene-4-oatehydrolase [Hyphomicrobiales bacterium]|nr:4,5-9,10-diseco-3-hydroxy-5,9, 17-trioxoandrosta(10),2-diene-4-oatehydrolase [Hyphomicrobiales bacterium]